MLITKMQNKRKRVAKKTQKENCEKKVISNDKNLFFFLLSQIVSLFCLCCVYFISLQKVIKIKKNSNGSISSVHILFPRFSFSSFPHQCHSEIETQRMRTNRTEQNENHCISDFDDAVFVFRSFLFHSTIFNCVLNAHCLFLCCSSEIIVTWIR